MRVDNAYYLVPAFFPGRGRRGEGAREGGGGVAMVAGAAARALAQAAAEEAGPTAEETLGEAIDFVFVLFSAYLVFFMQSGFAMVSRRR